MGFKPCLRRGREDDWEADLVYWGPETEMLADERYRGDGSSITRLPLCKWGLFT